MTTANPEPLRVCYVGSSHMVAHKVAADADPPRDAALTFRGLAGQEFFAIEARDAHLAVERERLVVPQARKPLWEPLESVVPYDAHDVFVVVGPIKTWQLVEATAMLRLPTRAYSERYLKSGMQAMVDTDHGLRLSAGIKKHSGKPTLFLAAPLPAEPPAVVAAEPRETYLTALARIENACDAQGLGFVSQPEETLENWCATREEFARGSISYTGEAHRADERKHMNANYGRIALKKVIDVARRAATKAAAAAA